MKNRKEWPIEDLTPEKLYALELAARRERAREVRRLLAAAGRYVKSVVSRAFASRGSRGMRHA
jgi:hypothetical protein